MPDFGTHPFPPDFVRILVAAKARKSLSGFWASDGIEPAKNDSGGQAQPEAQNITILN